MDEVLRVATWRKPRRRWRALALAKTASAPLIAVALASLLFGVSTGLSCAFWSAVLVGALFFVPGWVNWASHPLDWPRCYRRRCKLCGNTYDFVPSMGSQSIRALPSSTEDLLPKLAGIRLKAWLPYLDEIRSRPGPDQAANAKGPFKFAEYQRALGEVVTKAVGWHADGYVRGHPVGESTLEDFTAAASLLRAGSRDQAKGQLEDLTLRVPEFAEAWIWLSGMQDDPLPALERAVQLEPSHPLARAAMAVASGKPLEGEATHGTRCQSCAGALRYDSDTKSVLCSYCGAPHAIDAVFPPTRQVNEIGVRRAYAGTVWTEVARSLACDACGAPMSRRRLSDRCLFCGGTTVVERGELLERPWGIIRFMVNEHHAAQAIRAECGAVIGLNGLFVPLWLFDGTVEEQWFDPGGQRMPGGRTHDVPDLVFPAATTPAPSQIDALGGFDATQAVAYDPAWLADHPAELPSRDVVVTSVYAADAALVLARIALGKPVLSDPSMAGAKRAIQVSELRYRLLLVPVWCGRTSAGKGVLLNGQNGTIFSGFPMPMLHGKEAPQECVNSTESLLTPASPHA